MLTQGTIKKKPRRCDRVSSYYYKGKGIGLFWVLQVKCDNFTFCNFLP